MKSENPCDFIDKRMFNKNRCCIEIISDLLLSAMVELFNKNKCCIEIGLLKIIFQMLDRLIKTDVVLKLLDPLIRMSDSCLMKTEVVLKSYNRKDKYC